MRRINGMRLAVMASLMVLAGAADAQEYTVGQTVEANMGSGPWMVCTVVKHNVKQADYEVSCPARPTDTFRAADDADHLRPHHAGSDALAGIAATASRPAAAVIAKTPSAALPSMGVAPPRSASNVLFGRWRLTAGECHTLVMEFLPTVSRDYDIAVATSPAAWSQRDVDYFIMSARDIVVRAKVGGGWGKYKIIDANHMVPDSMFQCTYTRM